MTLSTPATLVPAAPARLRPGVAVRHDLVEYGRRLLDRGRLTEALASFEAAAMQPPADPRLAPLINRVHRRLVPRWHFAMLNDAGRNAAYRQALEQVDVRGKVVLDVGSGSGLLAMMAADLGAAQVYSCEGVEAIAAQARRIVSVNGKSDVVKVIPRESFDLVVGRDLDEPADVLVTETIDCGLLGEGLLAIVDHAKSNLLHPGAQILPGAATLHAALIESPDVHANNYAFRADAFDVALFNEFSTLEYFPVRLDTWPHRWLSDPVDLFAIDLQRDQLGLGSVERDLTVTRTGVVHGVAMWFTVELVPGVTISNAPFGQQGHWMQAVQCFESAVPVSAGQHVRMTATHDLTGAHVQIS